MQPGYRKRLHQTNKEAIQNVEGGTFQRWNERYRIPEEPECGENVKIRFRTGAGDVDHVYAVIRDGGKPE